MLYVAWKSTYHINRSLRVNHVVVSHVHTDESEVGGSICREVSPKESCFFKHPGGDIQ